MHAPVVVDLRQGLFQHVEQHRQPQVAGVVDVEALVERLRQRLEDAPALFGAQFKSPVSLASEGNESPPSSDSCVFSSRLKGDPSACKGSSPGSSKELERPAAAAGRLCVPARGGRPRGGAGCVRAGAGDGRGREPTTGARGGRRIS